MIIELLNHDVFKSAHLVVPNLKLNIDIRAQSHQHQKTLSKKTPLGKKVTTMSQNFLCRLKMQMQTNNLKKKRNRMKLMTVKIACSMITYKVLVQMNKECKKVLKTSPKESLQVMSTENQAASKYSKEGKPKKERKSLKLVISNSSW